MTSDYKAIKEREGRSIKNGRETDQGQQLLTALSMHTMELVANTILSDSYNSDQSEDKIVEAVHPRGNVVRI
jgi:hypothetical protein